MKLVIAGAGEVGFHLIENLRHEDLHILAIDTDAEVLETLHASYGIKTDQAAVIDSRFMNRSYLEDTDLFLAITNSDETNMIACKMASEAGVKQTICRIRQVDFSEEKKQVSLKALGIDRVINPVSLVADEIFHLLKAPNSVDRHEFSDGNIVFVGFKISEASTIIGQDIKSLKERLTPMSMKIGIIQRDDLPVVPHDDVMIKEGDVVYFFCRGADFQELRSFLGYRQGRSKPKRIFINGGGHIGVQLALRLENTRHEIKIIEKDLARSYQLSERLQHAMVLNFDGSDLKQLIAEGIENADYFISVTSDEKANMTSCLLAADQKVPRTICLVHQPEFISIIDQKTPISLGISPRMLTTRYLARFIQGSNVQSYFPLINSEISVLEMHLNDLTPCLGVPLKDLQFPEDVLIGIIERDGEIVIPKGHDMMQAGDKILLILHRLDKEETMQFFQPLAF